MTNVLAGLQHDRWILLLACQVVEVDHQLEMRMPDGLDELQALARRIDDVRFLPAQRFDRDRDARGLCLGRNAPAEVDELLPGFGLVESLGDLPCAAAAEDDDLGAEP